MTRINFLKNFREFAVKGTVVDMGIGVIVGTAFIRIVDSLVADIIMPPLGLILGRVNFSNLYINLSGGHYRTLAEAKEAGAVTINYGLFIDSIINFAIIAMAAYFTILQINRIKRAPAESMSSKECPYCFVNIPVRAVRCPNCTTILISNPVLEKKQEKQQTKPILERQVPATEAFTTDTLKTNPPKTEPAKNEQAKSDRFRSEPSKTDDKERRRVKINFKQAGR